MIKEFAEIAAACDLSVPERLRRRVGIVGSGAIIDAAHLPTYRKAGIPVTAIWARNSERARSLAATHGITTIHASLDALLADPAVEVVDIGVTPDAQVEIALQALDARKHLICQKPLALDINEACRIATRAAEVGRLVAVQQQMRFEEGIRAARTMILRGWIGHVTQVTFDVNIWTDFAGWGWLGTEPRLEVFYHSIHYLDTIRSILGDPVRVFSTHSRRPGQEPVGETRTTSVLIYPGEVRALVHSNHENVARDNTATFRIDGTDGSIRGTLGLLYDYPVGRPDTLEVWSRVLPTDGWLPYPVTTRWIPDAFIGPVRSLLAAMADGGQPETSVGDNLSTLALAFALYQSAETGEAVAFAPPALAGTEDA